MGHLPALLSKTFKNLQSDWKHLKTSKNNKQHKIFSKTTKSHPLEIFLIIIIGGLLFGIVGMITAVPCYTALKVILKEFLADNKIVKSLTKDI